MSSETTFVFALIGVAGALMASNRVRFDVVALLVVLALMISGILTVGETLAGFGSPVVIVVAGLLVIGEMLARTGVASLVGDWILTKGGSSETRLLVLIMLGAAVLGAVMSSTAVVAIFIPIILRIARDTGLNKSRLLLPMSYAALISGMLTLIGTTPNIVVHEELKTEGFEGFGFFGFSAIGAVILVVAITYVLLLGRRLLPAGDGADKDAAAHRSVIDLWRSFNSHEDFQRARIQAGSPLVGKAIAEAGLEHSYGVRLAGIVPGGSSAGIVVAPSSSTQYVEGDIVLLVGRPEELARLVEEQRLLPLPKTRKERTRWLWDVGGASVVVHPESKLLGKTVRELEFHTRYRLQVLGMRRGTEIVEDYAHTPLGRGDSLFVLGPWSRIQQLGAEGHDFVVLEMPSELADIVPSHKKRPVSLAILAAMVLLTVFDIVPLTAAVLMAVLAAVFTRCLTMEDAYRSIHWSSIILIAGMLPLADALTATGGTQLVVDALMDMAGDAGPYAMLSILFFLTAGLGLVLSNTASAVLVAPIAIYAARFLEVSPYPFAVAVLIAASAAFSTPVSTPVVTLVVDPGRYKFSDFIKVGVPLLFLSYLATLVVAPLVFPF
jgi:di/tricarboxylate transporter